MKKGQGIVYMVRIPTNSKLKLRESRHINDMIFPS